MRYWSASRLADLWDEVRNSYWLLPAVMVIGAIGLAVGMSYVDLIVPEASGGNGNWATALQAGAARTILATVAGSMATIVGVVFSITIVALQLASSQFGPHVLRSFLTDRGSQTALGALLGSFTYSLLIIVVIRSGGGFVPYASTYVGILVGLIAIGMLIYFINHVAKLISAESVIASLANEVARATEQVFPDQLGADEPGERQGVPTVPADFAVQSCDVAANAGGYIRRIDDAALLRLACAHDLLIRLDVRPGDFVVQGALLMAAAPADRINPSTAHHLRQTVLLGHQRTPEQDVAFALQHLEEVAIRSLSPGINAPFSAIPAIDQIAAGLARLAARRMPSPFRRDQDGKLRILVMRPQRFAELVQNTLGPIASAATAHAEVMAHVIETVLLVVQRASAEDDRAALRAFLDSLVQEGLAGVASERERTILRTAVEHAGASAAASGRVA